MARTCVLALALAVGTLSGLVAEDSLSVGPRFHWETSIDENGFKGSQIAYGGELPLYKSYEGSPIIKLPPAVAMHLPLGKTLTGRQSIREYSDQSINLSQLAAILYAADGITHARGGYDLRSAPSGGALYPIEIYVLAHAVDSLKPGLYHFQVADSSLALVREGDFRESIGKAALDQIWVGSSAATFVLTARFERSTRKYGDRGYRYTYIEAGAICQNISLAATALQMGTAVVGAFIDDAVNEVIGIDGRTEAALLIMPVGQPSSE